MRKALLTCLLFMAFEWAAAPPETVLVYDFPKRGKEAALEAVLREHWELISRNDWVAEGAPHVLVRGADAKGRIYFVEVFTWKNGDIPDHAPPELLKVWAAMNALVEKRDGRPGIDITQVTAVK